VKRNERIRGEEKKSERKKGEGVEKGKRVP